MNSFFQQLERRNKFCVGPPQWTEAFFLLGVRVGREFIDLRNRHRNNVTSQRDELFAIASGPDGFDIWQPSDSECGRKAAPPVPN